MVSVEANKMAIRDALDGLDSTWATVVFSTKEHNKHQHSNDDTSSNEDGYRELDIEPSTATGGTSYGELLLLLLLSFNIVCHSRSNCRRINLIDRHV